MAVYTTKHVFYRAQIQPEHSCVHNLHMGGIFITQPAVIFLAIRIAGGGSEFIAPVSVLTLWQI